MVALFALRLQFAVPWWWYLAPVVVYVAVCAAFSFVMQAQFFLPAICRGINTGKRIAITFDDGPMAGPTDRLLDILEKYKIKSAFFCIGAHIARNKNLLRRIAGSGHVIGNHSYSHKPTFGFMSRGEVARELDATDRQIEEITGRRPRFFRPPFGVTNPMIAQAVEAGGYKTIGWSVRSFDTIIKDADKLLKRVTKPLAAGDIVLFHDYSDSMLDILPRFIEFARRTGFEIVPLDELLKEDAYR